MGGLYVAPNVGVSGIVIPTFQAIYNYLVSQLLSTYGASTYTGADSPDIVDISIRSLQATDSNLLAQAVFNSFNPEFALGTSLDLCGALIGTPRKAASFSSAIVTITGTPGTIINNGVVRDTNNNQWNLPSIVTIGSGGTVMVNATAQTIGNITASINTIIFIAQPATAGWTGVNNSSPAVPGEAVEPDSQYRARLLVAQAKPSLTLLAGTSAAVAAVPSVTRSVVYENPANFTAGYGLVSTSGTSVTLVIGYPFDNSDNLAPITINGVSLSVAASGVSGPTTLTLTSSAGTQSNVPYFIGTGTSLGPPHSITAVVEGGTSQAIAQAIYNNRGLGCFTNGTTSVSVSDPLNPAITMSISFDILTYVTVYVSLNIHALQGYTSATTTLITNNVVNYLNGLGIGKNVIFSQLYFAAASAEPNPFSPSFSIFAIASGEMAAQTTATLNSSTTIVVASNTGIANGQTVVGNGIPVNTTVSSISGMNIVISHAATITSTGVAVSFFPTGTVDLNVPYNQAALGSATFVNINLV